MAVNDDCVDMKGMKLDSVSLFLILVSAWLMMASLLAAEFVCKSFVTEISDDA